MLGMDEKVLSSIVTPKIYDLALRATPGEPFPGTSLGPNFRELAHFLAP